MATKWQRLVTHVFTGGRFDDNGIEVDCLKELSAYKTILVETTKELWRRNNPRRERIPRNYENLLSLKFYAIEPGSAAVPLYRQVEVSELQMEAPRDELDEAVELVAETVQAASDGSTLPDGFPRGVLSLFQDYGQTLGADEHVEHSVSRPRRIERATYTHEARERLAKLVAAEYQDHVDAVGSVFMADVRNPKMAMTLANGQSVTVGFNPEDEDGVLSALKDHDVAKIRVIGLGVFSGDGQLQRIVDGQSISLLASGELEGDPSAPPIWETLAKIMEGIPDEELAKLPTDGAAQLDHYIYGTPKKDA